MFGDETSDTCIEHFPVLVQDHIVGKPVVLLEREIRRVMVLNFPDVLGELRPSLLNGHVWTMLLLPFRMIELEKLLSTHLSWRFLFYEIIHEKY